jgi:hypothetical protein
MSNYIKPTTKVIAVSTQQMIAESLGTNGIYTEGGGITLGGKDNGFLWDEDEDDDPMGAPTFDVWEE